MKIPRLRVEPLSPVEAATVSLATEEVRLGWTPAKGGLPRGYIIRWGTRPGQYTDSRDVGLLTETVLPGLETGQTYYFVIGTYYNEKKTPLALSAEISYKIP